MKMRNLLTVLGIVLLGSALLFAGCSGGGSGGTAPGAGGGAPSFNVKGSSQLIALSNTVAPISKPAGVAALLTKVGVKDVPTLQPINQGLSNEEVRARLKGKISSAPQNVSQAGGTPTPIGTNLLAVVADTDSVHSAIISDYLVKVMYAVTDPSGEYVYIALDTGFVNPDGNDYSKFIAANNCAFYRVSLSDNSYSCVEQGVYVQPIDDSYTQRVSGNQKPIQFDSSGNMYFPGTAFKKKCDDSGACTIQIASWNPRIYRRDDAKGEISILTQDNQKISYFLVLSKGEIAYQSINPQTGEVSLYLWEKIPGTVNINGTTINLTGSVGGVDFFNVDNYKTIMWGGFTESGLRFARPALSGVDMATLDTKNLRSYVEDTCDPQRLSVNQVAQLPYAPRRIIVGDDGRLYGIFEESIVENTKDSAGVCNKTSDFQFFTSLKVYQVLPFSKIPKAEIKFQKQTRDAVFDWQRWMGSTPFQVSQGFLYYKETQTRFGYGNVDVIKMVDLSGKREPITLLANDWFQIYAWRLKGSYLTFAALDLQNTMVVTGKINTEKVAELPTRPWKEYLQVQFAVSAIAESGRVQDIEPILVNGQEVVTAAPQVVKYHISSENRSSASVEFNKEMDFESVESALTFTDTDANPDVAVATMKVWINHFLHLIPDLDYNGTDAPNDALLDLKNTTQLKYKTNYVVSIPPTATDKNGTLITNALLSKSFQTRPKFGWYVSDGLGKFAGPPRHPMYDYYIREDIFDMNTYDSASSTFDSVPQNFRYEAKFKNTEYARMTLRLWDSANPLDPTGPVNYTYPWNPTYTYTWNGTYPRFPLIISLEQGGYGYVSWATAARVVYDCGAYPYIYGGARSANLDSVLVKQIFNGDWTYIRVDVIGSAISIYYSTTGLEADYVKIPLNLYNPPSCTNVKENNISDFRAMAPDSGTGRKYKMFLGLNSAMDFGYLKVSNLALVTGVVTPTDNMVVDFASLTEIPHGIIDTNTIDYKTPYDPTNSNMILTGATTTRIPPLANVPELSMPIWRGGMTYGGPDYPITYTGLNQ